MQTFLPYPDFAESAKCLDYRRLGKQRVEAKQLLNILLNRTAKSGWRNHPACLMWKGFEPALMLYFNIMRDEWIRRGYNNTMQPEAPGETITMPPWMGLATFHASHRSNLLRKDPIHYGKFGWTEPNNLEYYWP